MIFIILLIYKLVVVDHYHYHYQKYVFINKNGFYPKCISNDKTGMKALGHSASGHLLPCCWCDNGDPGYASLLTEELKIENKKFITFITSRFLLRCCYFLLKRTFSISGIKAFTKLNSLYSPVFATFSI